MTKVTLYTRQECHLCDEVIKELASLQNEFPHELFIVDIDNNPIFLEKYSDDIPVVEIENFVLKAPISSNELSITLRTVSNRKSKKTEPDLDRVSTDQHPERKVNLSIVEAPPAKWTRSDSISYWVGKHYLAMVNLFVILFIGLPFLAPIFMKAGWITPATMIYRVYSVTCHQLAYRSFFLFGEQLFYPREAAGIGGIETFQNATQLGEGNNPQDVLTARNFVGDEKNGYKIAICQRDIAIYMGILIFNFIFTISGRRIKPLHWLIWILLALVPIGLDGVSQLISQPPLSFIPFRESTPILRTITGFLFGFSTAWFGIPHIESSMSETREIFEYKKQQLLKTEQK